MLDSRSTPVVYRWRCPICGFTSEGSGPGRAATALGLKALSTHLRDSDGEHGQTGHLPDLHGANLRTYLSVGPSSGVE
ncbi:MAG: hypothetical protein ABEJ28_01145 [Salinigranum sp.]